MAPRPQYERGFSFAAFQANQPKKSLPGQRVDIELDEIADRISGPITAYEIAVANGFVGSETDYLASLVGPPGAALTLDQLVAPGNVVGDALRAAPQTVKGNTSTNSATQQDIPTGQIAFAALGAPNVRKQEDRANDFTLALNWKASTDTDDFASVGRAQAALMAKVGPNGGGKVRLQQGTSNLANNTVTIGSDLLRYVGEGSGSRVVASRSSGPVFRLGNDGAGCSRAALSGLTIENTVVHTGAIVLVKGAFDPLVDDVNVRGLFDTAFQVEGGGVGYLTKLRRVRCFGGNHLLDVGSTARVANLDLDQWEAGSTVQEAIRLFDVSGMQIGAGETLQCLTGLFAYINTNKLLEALRISEKALFDTNFQEGIKILTDGTGEIHDVKGSGLWCASNGQATTSGGTRYPGMRIQGIAPGYITGLSFTEATFLNNGQHGVVVINAENIDFTAVRSSGNGAGQGAGGGFGYVFGGGARQCRVIGGSARGRYRASTPAVQQYGITTSGDADFIRVSSSPDMTGNTIAATFNGSTGTNNVLS